MTSPCGSLGVRIGYRARFSARSVAARSSLAFVPPPFGEMRKEIRRTVREGLALTPEIQRELWPDAVPVALERTDFDWKKDLAAPALGQLPALIFFGIGGRAGGFVMGRAL